MRQLEHLNRRQTTLYQKLLSEKKRFVIPATIFLLCFYFSLPLLTSYFPVWMNVPVWGKISAAWILAFAQFIMTWLIGTLYLWKARRLDFLVSEIRRESTDHETSPSIKQGDLL
jgi:uncharacterized membrane protein (DUF485 family)